MSSAHHEKKRAATGRLVSMTFSWTVRFVCEYLQARAESPAIPDVHAQCSELAMISFSLGEEIGQCVIGHRSCDSAAGTPPCRDRNELYAIAISPGFAAIVWISPRSQCRPDGGASRAESHRFARADRHSRRADIGNRRNCRSIRIRVGRDAGTAAITCVYRRRSKFPFARSRFNFNASRRATRTALTRPGHQIRASASPP